MPKIARQLPTPPAVLAAPSENGDDVWGRLDTVRMLLYGKSGTGKTTLASTFPGPIQWLICSGGDKPGELMSINTPENRRKIRPLVVHTSDDFRRYVTEGKEYATTVLDHGSGLADMLLKEILGVGELPAQKGWGMATQQQYGQLALQCKECFRALLNLPGNVVIICQERVFGEESASELIQPTVGAALTPSVTGWLNPACDYVVQTFLRPRTKTARTKIGDKEVTTTTRVRGVEYCLRTEPHDVYQIKFRIPRGRQLPEYLADPNYEKIVKLIRG